MMQFQNNTHMLNHKEKQDAEWTQWSGNKDTAGKERFDWVLKRLKLWFNIKTILDAGCGPGWHTRQFPKQYNVTGSDISSIAIKMAKEEYPDNKFIVQPIEEIDKNYDGIMCIAVMNMVEDDKKAIEVISKHCKIGWFAFQTYADHALHLRKYDNKSVRELIGDLGEIKKEEEIKDFIMMEVQFND